MERLLDYFRPEEYVLDIAIDKNKKTIGGVVVVTGKVLEKTVKFHAVNLDVSEVKVDGDDVKYEADGEVLVISGLNLGKAEILIRYGGKLNENMEGAYLSTYEYKGKTETIVATQFESHYAREAFPCIDEPEAKAVFKLSISVPEDSKDIILSNMPVMDESEMRPFSGRGSSRPSLRGSDLSYLGRNLRMPSNGASPDSSLQYRVISFEPTPKMSTYLLAWVVGKFHGKTVMNKHGVEITTYCALNQDVDSVDFANEIAAKSLEFYDDNFKVPYPLKKLDQVALPDFEAGAMENWGLVTYRESMMLVPKNATLGAKKSVALTVAHELSHQWFGDLVTMKWWDDLWLNESFASVMEYYAVDHIHPEYKIFEGFFTGDSYAALMRDAYTDVQSVHQEVHDPAEIATLFDGAIVYAKGARLMLMLIRLMGWDKFCEGVAKYFEKYKYGNTVGDDLWEALKPYADFDPKALMHAFIDRPGYPVIMDGGLQKRFILDGDLKDEEWPIPEVTEDMSGHYVLDLSEEEFKERLEKFDELTLEEKVRLLIDRNLISKTELASSASLIPLAKKFANESSAAVWGIVLSILSGLKIFFDEDSEEEKLYKKFVGELVGPKLKEIGLTTKSSDDENTIRLRAILLGLDYYAEDLDNLRQLADLFDKDYQKIEPEIRESVLDAKLYFEPGVINDYLKAYNETPEPELKFELLFAGTISKDRKVLDKMVALLGQSEIVKPQDQTYLFVYLYRNQKTRERVFNWLTQHWDYVKNMMGDKSLDDYPRYMANAIRLESEYKEWREFFEPMKSDPMLARTIKIGKKEIEARLRLISNDKKAVYEALKENCD